MLGSHARARGGLSWSHEGSLSGDATTRLLHLAVALWQLVPEAMAPQLESGDIRYDPVSGDELQLVHNFKSAKPRTSLWSVVLPDGSLKVMDLAGRKSRKRAFVGAGRYRTVPKFSQAEWAAIEQRSLALKLRRAQACSDART